MSSNLEKSLIELGWVKSTVTNVGNGTTTFTVINPHELCGTVNTGVTTTIVSNSTQAEKDYYNSIEWRLPNGTTTMTPTDYPVSYATIKPVIELRMLRDERNKKLAETDWTQASDSPLSGSKKTEWATYRQSLRDITTSTQTIFSVTWPTKPS